MLTILKRDKSNENFNEKKIYNAVMKAFREVPNSDLTQVETVTDYVVQVLESSSEPITIEMIQDVVVVSLMHLGHYKVAEKYILYRDQKAKERLEKEKILDTQYLDSVSKSMTENQLLTLKKRYLICDVWYTTNEKGERVEHRRAREQPSAMFERIAKGIAIGDFIHDLEVLSPDNFTRKTRPLINFDEKKLGNLFYEQNWEIFNQYNLNPYHAGRILYLFEQIGSFRIRPILEQVQIGEEFYSLKITKELIPYLEKHFGDKGIWKMYYNRMVKGEYMFNTPVLMNFGRPLGGGNACFVLSMKDDLDDIMFTTSVRASRIYKKAGGLGVNVSNLRPEGDIVADIQGGSSGAISWLEAIDDTTERVKAGTGRRGANMGILEYWHPDIEKFINCKKEAGVLENFNISVGLDANFWNKLYTNEPFDLINPRDKKIWGQMDTRRFFDNIAESAHASAEPGVLFFDNANKFNPFKPLFGDLNATNPCGEQYLYPNDSCTLASVNAAKFVTPTGGFDKEAFEIACKEVIRGLDNVVSVSLYPDAAIEETTKQFRRVGIGIMGVGDALYKMRIGYNTQEGYEVMSMIAKSMHEAALEESIDLAFTRGQAVNWRKLTQVTGKSSYDLVKSKIEGNIDLSEDYIKKLNTFGIRNSWVGTEAPTGTISMISGCSSGIEPVFGLFYEKTLADKTTKFKFWNQHFINALKEEGIYSQELLDKIVQNYSSCEGINEIPDWIKKVFVTAITMHWGDHVFAQSIWQQYVDNSISKTINMPSNATVEDVKQAYFLAHALNCKGLSIYRDKSRHEQILHIESTKEALRLEVSDYVKEYIRRNLKGFEQYLPTFFNDYVTISEGPSDYSIIAEGYGLNAFHIEDGVCECGTEMVLAEGCIYCPNCGNGACHT